FIKSFVMKQKLKTYFTRLFLWSPVIWVFNENVFTISTVKGRSMQPTLNPDSNELKNDIVILNKLSNFERKYKVGDIITLKSPTDPNKLLIKRIKALEGELVSPLKIDKRSLKAFKAESNVIQPPEIVYIPKGHCWVEGDESFHSNDSNSFGPVPLGLITSKVSFIVYPFDRFGPIPSYKEL
ncbi:putative peptidase, partial [Neoconidiobolus thromboides FSU 785]